MKNEKYKPLSPLTHTPMLSTLDFPLKVGESVRGGKSPFKGDLEGLVFFIFHFSFFTFHFPFLISPFSFHSGCRYPKEHSPYSSLHQKGCRCHF